MAKSVLDTPCIGICSTVYGDTVCRGCKRFYKEVIEWNTFGDTQKYQVYSRLSHLMSEVVSRFLVIVDPKLLLQQLQNHSIRYHRTDNPFCWAHHLLRVGVDKIQNINHYGINVKEEYLHLNLSALFTLIDESLYVESERCLNNAGMSHSEAR